MSDDTHLTPGAEAATAEDHGPRPAGVVAALLAVMDDVREVRKGDRNNQQGYQFRGIDAVMNAVGPALRRHGVLVLPLTERADWREVSTSTGKASRECTVTVRYRFYGPAGDHLDAIVPGEAMDFGDKASPKAMSVAFRTALLQGLALPTDAPDPDAESYERGAAAEAHAHTARALDALRRTCSENGFDLNTVAARFATTHNGASLKACRDPEVIEKFRQSLYALPAAELTAATDSTPTAREEQTP